MGGLGTRLWRCRCLGFLVWLFLLNLVETSGLGPGSSGCLKCFDSIIVALYVPWCRHLDALPDVEPQLYADSLNV